MAHPYDMTTTELTAHMDANDYSGTLQHRLWLEVIFLRSALSELYDEADKSRLDDDLVNDIHELLEIE